MSKINVTRARKLGFKTNWWICLPCSLNRIKIVYRVAFKRIQVFIQDFCRDLSGTFMPYDGLFLPYQDTWENLGPINGGLAKYNVT